MGDRLEAHFAQGRRRRDGFVRRGRRHRGYIDRRAGGRISASCSISAGLGRVASIEKVCAK